MKLAYERYGNPESPHLIFLHGLGGTGAIWRGVTALLEEHFDCVCPDQRGHGNSRPALPPDASYHASDYAADLAELLHLLKIDSAILIGHSMGVRTALAAATLIPNLVRGVLGVDLGISEQWGGGVGFRLAEFLKNLPESFSGRVIMKEYLNKNCPDPAIAQYLGAVAKPTATETGEMWVMPFDHQALVATIEQAHLAPIKQWVQQTRDHSIPLLMLHGQNSKVWSIADYEEQKAIWTPRGVQFESWENTSHGLPFEARIRFVERIKQFQHECIQQMGT